MNQLLEIIGLLLLMLFIMVSCDPKGVGEMAGKVRDGFTNSQNAK